MKQHSTLAQAIQNLFTAVAEANNISITDVEKGFTVQPKAVQAMYDEIAQSTELLKKINIVGKTERIGQIIGLSTGLIGSNTDTNQQGKERQAMPIYHLNDRSYLLEKTNFDTAIRYEDMDGWAHINQNFPARVNKHIAQSIALSLITIGINGKERAKNSNIQTHPLLQDVAKGWLQKMREENPSRVLGWEAGAVGSIAKNIQYGNGADDYKNLDAVVTDALNELMDERFADRSDYIVLASRRTVGDKYLRIINASGDRASEIESGGRLNQQRTLGGLPVMYVPNFPANTLFITPLKNLSIYYQISGERRHIKDKPEKDQLETYQSKNIDFIVEEYGAAALIENLEHIE